MKNKLAIITTHPIQYNAPLFKLITERQKIEIKVFYTWEQSKEKVWDKKFGREIKWDIPLLEGYHYEFVKNISKNPGSGTFSGVKNPSLISKIESWQPDAILIFGWNHQSHFKAMRYFKGKIRIYFRGDSTLIDEKPGIKTILRRISLKYIYRYIDYAFYVGKNNKAYYLKHGLKEKCLIFAPHAIDNNRFFDKTKAYQEKAKSMRQKLGFSEQDKVIVFAGKFENKKQPMLLIDAAKQLPELKFLFIGNGEQEESLKKKAGKNCFFLPFQNQSLMPVIYRLGEIFVLPSQGPEETWGLVINEAMACGKPILTTNKVGCAIDLVKPGVNGYIFEAGNLLDLIKKIQIALPKAEEFGNASLDIIAKWSYINIAETIEKHMIQNETPGTKTFKHTTE